MKTSAAPEQAMGKSLQEIQIREMQPADLDEVLHIERSSFSHPWSAVHFLSSLYRKPVAQCWVSASEERIEGYVIAWYISRYSEEAGEAHIHNIAVRPESRRAGIGQRLLKTAVDYGQDSDCRIVSLEVRASNEAAKEFYHRYGFQVQGRRENYYGDDDALVMTAGVETIRATI